MTSQLPEHLAALIDQVRVGWVRDRATDRRWRVSLKWPTSEKPCWSSRYSWVDEEDARQHARKFEFLLTRPKSAHCRLVQLPDLTAEQRADAFAVSADVLDAWDSLLRMQ